MEFESGLGRHASRGNAAASRDTASNQIRRPNHQTLVGNPDAIRDRVFHLHNMIPYAIMETCNRIATGNAAGASALVVRFNRMALGEISVPVQNPCAGGAHPVVVAQEVNIYLHCNFYGGEQPHPPNLSDLPLRMDFGGMSFQD